MLIAVNRTENKSMTSDSHIAWKSHFCNYFTPFEQLYLACLDADKFGAPWLHKGKTKKGVIQHTEF